MDFSFLDWLRLVELLVPLAWSLIKRPCEKEGRRIREKWQTESLIRSPDGWEMRYSEHWEREE